MKPNTKESLLKNTLMQDGCWLYQGAAHGPTKHCKVRWENRKIYIHRLSAHLHWGFDLDSPTLILHRQECPNPNCWNPDHLYEGTHADNAADSIALGTFRNVVADEERQRMYCPYGHEYTEENTYKYPKTGKRACKECNRQRAAQHRVDL